MRKQLLFTLIITLLSICSHGQNKPNVKPTNSATIDTETDINFNSTQYTCDDLVERVYDEISGSKYSVPKLNLDLIDSRDKGNIIGVKMLISHTNGMTLAIIFKTKNNPMVVNEDGEINFLFEDGTRAVTNSLSSTYNSDGTWTLYFSKNKSGYDIFNTEQLMVELSIKTIKAIRLFGYSKTVSIYPSHFESFKFQQTFKCLSDEL